MAPAFNRWGLLFNEMAITYNPATDAGKVRLLISDTVEEGHIFEDAEIQAFLDLNDGSIRLAAADGLYAIAANKARLAKRIKVLDIDIDTRQLAKDLKDLADTLREQEDDDGSFQIAELVTNHWSGRERVWKQMQRGVI